MPRALLRSAPYTASVPNCAQLLKLCLELMLQDDVKW